MSYENYNNGVPPEPGLSWNGESWGYPTTGYTSGDTMTVWPENNTQYPIESFNPVTGNGWVPAVDGMWEFPPTSLRSEMQIAISKATQSFNSPQWDNLMSAPFWRFTPSVAGYPNPFGGDFPVIIIVPAKIMTDTPLSPQSTPPSTIQVHTRILDDIHDGVQHMSAVGDRQQSAHLPVVQGKKLNGNIYFFGFMPGALNFLEFYMYAQKSGAEAARFWMATSENEEIRPAGATVGANSSDFIAWFPGSDFEPQYVSISTVMPSDRLQERQKVQDEAEAKNEAEKVKDAVKFTSDFYQVVTSKLGEQSAKVAQELADSAKGKKIRNMDEALRSFDKYKDSINKKYGVKDRETIAKALESLNRQEMANSLVKFSRGFGLTSKLIDGYDVLIVELPKALKSGDWRPLFLKVETFYVGQAATALTAFAFSALLGIPGGFLGYALILSLVGAFIDETLIEKLNKLFEL